MSGANAHRPYFWRWLMAQRDRDDPVGDLARDAAVDKDAPHDRHKFASYLRRFGDGPNDALKRAVAEWKAEVWS